MKSKKAIFNITTDALGRMVIIFLGFILPKLYISRFGSEVNGLLSSLSGIFVYLCLLEAGVGGASTQALYLPLANKQLDKINGILVATKHYYRRTGCYILACVSVLAFLYPVVVKSGISYFTVSAVIILSAAPTILRFFVQGKYAILLYADNRSYILNIFSMIFNIFTNVAKIILILCNQNIILIQAVFAFISVLQVVFIREYVRKNYSYLDLKVNANTKEIEKKSSVMIHEIAYAVTNNVDVIILTLFCGLKTVSVYAIYSMIFSQTGFLIKTISSGLTASFAKVYFEDKKKFNNYFKYFDSIYQSFVFAIFLTAAVLTTPFLKLYTKEFSDISYIDSYLPLLFMTASLLNSIRWSGAMTIDIAGHFKETQFQSLMESLLNLILSLALVGTFRIYGVIFATIIALGYRSIDIILYSNKYILFRDNRKQFIRIAMNSIVTCLLVVVYKNINLSVKGYLDFFIEAFIILGINLIIYFAILFYLELKEGLLFICNLRRGKKLKLT